MHLTPQQLAFMDTFGYLVFPGLLKAEITRITAEFESVFATHGGGHDGRPHDGSARSCIVPFIDQNEYLSGLLDDERVEGIFVSLLGEDFNYIGSDGNFYVGDTNWHSDTDWSGKMRGTPPRVFYKMALYLDPVTRQSGALRVIPGSQRWGDRYAEILQAHLRTSQEDWSISGAQVPAVALESVPGDVVVFNQNTKHSAWGGSKRRRMFTINCTAQYSEADLPYLRNEISAFARFWVDTVYGPAMTRNPGPRRLRHLRQTLDNQGHLAEEVRQARGAMKEPSRG
ncbi:MAG: phytanoyl-CoA dioxygenase family protein [Candidatus Handelsmanbacteria bacterium]|nr:phytanoyl-CoA dioxygenase family protein [Candidatus Handelsmanbacteria bacterium]